MRKTTLLIKGRISHMEIDILNDEFSNEEFYITKYETKGAAISGIHDIVSLIFNDLHPISFVRDYLFAKIIDISYSKVKHIITRLGEKQKVVDELTIMKDYYKQDGTIVFVMFTTESERFEILIQQVYENLSYDFFENIEANKNVSITLDRENKLHILIT